LNQALDVAQQSAQQGWKWKAQKVSQQAMDAMLAASRQSQKSQTV